MTTMNYHLEPDASQAERCSLVLLRAAMRGPVVRLSVAALLVVLLAVPESRAASALGTREHKNAVGQHQQVQARARAWVVAGKLEQAENELGSLSRAAVQTPLWRLELAQQLGQLADEFAQGRNSVVVRPIIDRALQHLSVAAQDSELRSASLQMAGGFQHRYLGDDVAALASFRAAAQAAPNQPALAANVKAWERAEQAAKKGRQ